MDQSSNPATDKTALLNPAVAHAVKGFISLVVLGWQTQLAFDCSYDGVFNILGKEEFLDLCEAAVKEKAGIVG